MEGEYLCCFHLTSGWGSLGSGMKEENPSRLFGRFFRIVEGESFFFGGDCVGSGVRGLVCRGSSLQSKKISSQSSPIITRSNNHSRKERETKK